MPSKPSFDSIINLYSDEIFAYLWRHLNGREDTEDCFQEVFLRAFKAYERLDEEAYIRAWLYKIATNEVMSYHRKRNRKFNYQIMLDQNLVPSDSSPIQHVEMKERFEVVMGAVNALPHRQRSAFLLRKYHELSYANIARILDCSEQAARANVYQALKKLRVRFLDTEQKEK